MFQFVSLCSQAATIQATEQANILSQVRPDLGYIMRVCVGLAVRHCCVRTEQIPAICRLFVATTGAHSCRSSSHTWSPLAGLTRAHLCLMVLAASAGRHAEQFLDVAQFGLIAKQQPGPAQPDPPTILPPLLGASR